MCRIAAGEKGETVNKFTASKEGCEVYAIQGIDSNTTTAVKFLLVSDKDAYYFYFKYVRQSYSAD